MSVGEKIMGFFLGLLAVGVGTAGVWGLCLGLQFLVKSMSQVVLANSMLGVLALPVAYGFGLAIVENRRQLAKAKVKAVSK